MDRKKFLILLFSTIAAAFVGAFLASYIFFPAPPMTFLQRPMFGNMAPPVSPPPGFVQVQNSEQMDKMFKDQQKVFENINDQSNNFIKQQPMPNFAFSSSNNFSNNGTSITTEETKDMYVIKVNLKPFDNDQKNIEVKIKGKKVTISAQYKTKDKNEYSSSQFYQSLRLPVDIDAKAVSQKKEGDFLVITIPKTKK